MAKEAILKSEISYLYSPMHSDILVHWTGRDIVKKFEGLHRGCNFDPNSREYPTEVVQAYIERLKSLIKNGLWLTEHQNGDDHVNFNDVRYKKPKVPRVCFTELKIASSMWHAKNFGALGIGFKRFYLFNRGGGPVFYVSNNGAFHHFFMTPRETERDESGALICLDYVGEERYSFFKNMSSNKSVNGQGYIPYDLYEEAEWRVVFSEETEKRQPDLFGRYFVKPSKVEDQEFIDSYTNSRIKPKYLMPIDQWVSIIIYPNLQVKNAAMKDEELQMMLKKVSEFGLLENSVPEQEKIPPQEQVNEVVQMDIGMVRNF